MTFVSPPPLACILNLDAVRKLYESAWRDGFQNGEDHGNLDYKHPPEDIAWLEHKNAKRDLFICLTRDELKAIEAWHASKYDDRVNPHRWKIDPEEKQSELEAISQLIKDNAYGVITDTLWYTETETVADALTRLAQGKIASDI